MKPRGDLFFNSFIGPPLYALVGWPLRGRTVKCATGALRGRLSEGARVLDVGTGNGKIAAALAENLGVAITGVDASPAMLRSALQAAKHLRCGNLTVKEGWAWRLPARDGEFDAVTCLQTLRFIPPGRTAKMLAEFQRVSRTDAPMVLLDWRVPIFPQGVWSKYTPAALATLAEDIGFIHEGTSRSGPLWILRFRKAKCAEATAPP